MYKMYLIVIFLILLDKLISGMPLTVIFMVVWFLTHPHQSFGVLAIFAGLFYDLNNNLLLGTAIASYGVVFGLIYLYQKTFPIKNWLRALPLAIASLFVWQGVVWLIHRYV